MAVRRSSSPAGGSWCAASLPPYVAGQNVKVSFYRDGRKVQVRKLSVLAVGNGAGQFHINYSSAAAGLVQARAAPLRDTSAGCVQRPLARACGSYTQTSRPARSGPSVRLLQSELNVLHYAVPLSGVLR